MSLSPAYASCNALPCFGDMKSSFTPCAKSAGEKLSGASFKGSSSFTSNFALRLMLLLKNEYAIFVIYEGTVINLLRMLYVSTSSRTSVSSDENGESSTMPAIEGSRCEYNNAVTAPMLCPHSPIFDVFPCALRCFTTASTSRISRTPSVTYSPSESPLPPRSSAKTVTRRGRSLNTTSAASHLEPLLPWR